VKKFLHGQACFSKYIFQGPPGNLFMIGDSYAAVWWGLVPEDHMAALLVVEAKPNFTQRLR
jgi:hypothetical protein